MNLCADRLLAILQVEAIRCELELLRDQYFYEPQHSDYNAFFYEYLEEVYQDGLSLEERLSISYKAFAKAIAYMNTFYPDARMDVDLLSFDMDNPYYPAVHIKPPKLHLSCQKKSTSKGSNKTRAPKRKRGRPKKNS